MDKPEALRLADWCEAHSSGVYRPSAEAAAELRRLHVQRDDLLDALRTIVANASSVQMDPQWAVQVARAAIAKAEEQT